MLAQFPFDLLGFHADNGFADVRRRLTKVEHRILGLKRDAVDTAAEIGEHRELLYRLLRAIEQMQKRIDRPAARAAR